MLFTTLCIVGIVMIATLAVAAVIDVLRYIFGRKY
jgi:hypothetical protein